LLHQKLDWTPQISDCGWAESGFVGASMFLEE
jgi:hypothetical protein